MNGRGDSIIALTKYDVGSAPLGDAVYFDILYPAIYAQDRREGRSRRPGHRRDYYLNPPDPWLLALADLMWQGIVQGLTWDVIKESARHAIKTMRQQRIAPDETLSQQKRSKTSLGFSWTQYASDGKKQYHLFVGLRRAHASATNRERARISRSFSRGRSLKTGNPQRRKRD